MSVVAEHGFDDDAEVGFSAGEQAGLIQGLVVGRKQRLQAPIEGNEVQICAGAFQNAVIPQQAPHHGRQAEGSACSPVLSQ